MSDYRVEVKVRNANILRLMEGRGIDTRLRQIDGKHEWVGLTADEAFELQVKHKDKPISLAAAVENLLREKNHG